MRLRNGKALRVASGCNPGPSISPVAIAFDAEFLKAEGQTYCRSMAFVPFHLPDQNTLSSWFRPGSNDFAAERGLVVHLAPEVAMHYADALPAGSELVDHPAVRRIFGPLKSASFFVLNPQRHRRAIYSAVSSASSSNLGLDARAPPWPGQDHGTVAEYVHSILSPFAKKRGDADAIDALARALTSPDRCVDTVVALEELYDESFARVRAQVSATELPGDPNVRVVSSLGHFDDVVRPYLEKCAAGTMIMSYGDGDEAPLNATLARSNRAARHVPLANVLTHPLFKTSAIALGVRPIPKLVEIFESLSRADDFSGEAQHTARQAAEDAKQFRSFAGTKNHQAYWDACALALIARFVWSRHRP
jgi:hypothetical protein